MAHTLLGDNYNKQDITAALALARDCKHPDAVWLTSFVEGKDVSTKEEARKAFLSCKKCDSRALCFAWFMTEGCEDDLTLLRRVAELGNAFACSRLSRQVWGEGMAESFRLAESAVAQKERDGCHTLGLFLRDGIGCESDLTLAKENFLIAAELGDILAAH